MRASIWGNGRVRDEIAFRHAALSAKKNPQAHPQDTAAISDIYGEPQANITRYRGGKHSSTTPQPLLLTTTKDKQYRKKADKLMDKEMNINRI